MTPLRLLPLLILVLVLPGACAPDVPAPAADASPDTTTLSVDTVHVGGPTLVGFFAVTQAEVDAGDEPGIGEALYDFQWHLAGARDSLVSLGVAVEESYADELVVLHDGGATRFTPRRDSVQVGYVFAAPGRPLDVVRGVHTDIELVAAVEDLLHLPPSGTEHDVASDTGP